MLVWWKVFVGVRCVVSLLVLLVLMVVILIFVCSGWFSDESMVSLFRVVVCVFSGKVMVSVMVVLSVFIWDRGSFLLVCIGMFCLV